MSHATYSVSRLRLAALMILLLATSLGCSLGQMLVGEPTPVPTPTPLPSLPTWTPSPVGALSPAEIATLTVLASVNFPTMTPTATPFYTPTPTPTWTPLPTPVDTPTPTPAPYALVVAPIVNVRSGPSVAYPIIGQARQDERYDIIGRNEAFTWWQICCVNGQQGWITTQLTAPGGPADTVPIVFPPDLPPTPFPTATPVDTPLPLPTPGPFRPVQLAEGPELWDTNNRWLTIWLKTFVGQPPLTAPIANLRLKVLRNSVDVSQPGLTESRFQFSAPTALGVPIGNRREYNLKYEYFPEAGDAQWTIIVTDANGMELSMPVTFETRGGQEVYVSFFDTR
jgi:hypothetical protein